MVGYLLVVRCLIHTTRRLICSFNVSELQTVRVVKHAPEYPGYSMSGKLSSALPLGHQFRLGSSTCNMVDVRV